MKKLLGNIYVGLGLAIIFSLLIYFYTVILFVLGILVGLFLINYGFTKMGAPTMQQRIKSKVMKSVNPFSRF